MNYTTHQAYLYSALPLHTIEWVDAAGNARTTKARGDVKPILKSIHKSGGTVVTLDGKAL